MSETTPKNDARPEAGTRQPWVRPEIRRVGTVGDVVRAGQNKLTVVGDPAEPGKVPGPDY
ncbi:MAG: hypothetical protein DIU54_003090 [Acidobacteriota bacterium]|jgi:hypothetical protein|nr:MAG: hypothetical protein DIU54_06555 [Acidobacteriota bacterium]